MKKHQIYILILSLVGFYCTNTSLAQNPPKDKVDDKQVTQQPMSTNSFKRPLSGFSTINFTPPTSPAARVIESSSISTVSAPDKFGFQLLNGLDSEGKFGNGLAIDVAPYLVIRGTNFTLEEYRNNDLNRFLANTKLSVATTRTDTSARIGVGIEFILLNDGDPRKDDLLLKDLSNVIVKSLNRDDAPPPGSPQEELDSFRDKIINPAILAVKNNPVTKKRLEQQQIWSVGFAESWVSPTANYRNFRNNGSGIWSTYKNGLGGESQIIIHGFYRSGENITDINGLTINGSNLLLGTRLVTGIDTKFSVETSYNIENSNGNSANSYLGYGIGIDTPIRIFTSTDEKDSLWLSLSMNGYSGRKNGGDFQMLSGIKWNFNDGR